jgi:Kef-type K+ transport system membrane component KefB
MLKLSFAIVLILAVSRLFSILTRRFNQPTSIAEITAGFILGPSIFGYLFPLKHQFFFSNEVLDSLETLSMIGSFFFLFLVGLETRKNQERDVSPLPKARILIYIIPSILIGILSGILLHDKMAPTFAKQSYLLVGLVALFFFNVSFPVLFRILQEKNLSKTQLGTYLTWNSSIIETCSWIFLGIWVYFIHNEDILPLYIGLPLFTVFLYVLRNRLVKRMSQIYVSRENLTKTAVTLTILVIFLCGAVADSFGLSIYLGAYMAGWIVPTQSKFHEIIQERVKDLTIVLFLPIFYAFVGQKINYSFFYDFKSIEILFGFTFLFLFFKTLVSLLYYKSLGFSKIEDLLFSQLLNSKGYFSYVVILLGLQYGILDAFQSTLLYQVAFFSTFVVSPIIYYGIKIQEKSRQIDADIVGNAYKILISFAVPERGGSLLRLAHQISKNPKNTSFSSIHFTPYASVSESESSDYQSVSFGEVASAAKDLNINCEFIYKATDNVTYEILSYAKKLDSNLLLLGGAKPLFSNDILGGRIRSIVSYCPCDLGVLIEKDKVDFSKVLLIFDPAKIGELQQISSNLSRNKSSKITIFSFDPLDNIKRDSKLEYISGTELTSNLVEQFTLVIVDFESWKKYLETLHIEELTSILIIKFRQS